MPLTDFQRAILEVLGPVRTPESYVAGGTVLHFSPNSTRFSRDLDLFHDALEGVSRAFEEDSGLLRQAGMKLEIVISQLGFIRAIVRREQEATQIEWARESAWRFLPTMRSDLGGYMLQPVDVATNKVLALAGRDEARDFVDILYVCDNILTLGPLVWSAVAKNPGYSPLALLEQLRRRGKYRQKDFSRLDLTHPFDLTGSKTTWMRLLEEADQFVLSRPPEESGCLYYHTVQEAFVEPDGRPLAEQGIVTHFGRAGGVLPRPA